MAGLAFGRSLALAIALPVKRSRGYMGCSTRAKADPLLQKQPQTRLSVIFEPLELDRFQGQQVSGAVDPGDDVHLLHELVLRQVECHDRAYRLQVIGGETIAFSFRQHGTGPNSGAPRLRCADSSLVVLT